MSSSRFYVLLKIVEAYSGMDSISPKWKLIENKNNVGVQDNTQKAGAKFKEAYNLGMCAEKNAN